MRTFLNLTVCLLAGAVTALAGDVSSNKVIALTCEVKLIEAPRSEVNRLLDQPTSTLTAEQLARLADWVAQKKAVVLAQPRLSTIAGNAAQVRAVHERRYASDHFDANFQSTIPPTNVGGAIPLPFRTREAGVLLNLTPTVCGADRQSVAVTLIPEFSWPSTLGRIKHAIVTPAGKTEVSQPDFYTWYVVTEVVFRSGSTVLLAILEPVHEEQYNSSDNVALVLLSAAIHSTAQKE